MFMPGLSIVLQLTGACKESPAVTQGSSTSAHRDVGGWQNELWSCTPGSMLPLLMAVQDHQAQSTATRGGLQEHVPSTGTKAMAEMPDVTCICRWCQNSQVKTHTPLPQAFSRDTHTSSVILSLLVSTQQKMPRKPFVISSLIHFPMKKGNRQMGLLW